ncbi:hypothetical protein [Aurantibacillus circumpalustris]|uniref:hypothetical protein n=1 Tax=Aurantibacillus circumpalustris TaxID=3036359 RepID=UPI00295A8886|nr:hypothetical protein [Aurantibacillus circumpalustris]
MQKLVLIDQEELNKLIQSVEELKKLVIAKPVPPLKQTKLDSTMEEIENYIPLHLAWKKLGCKKSKWYEKYVHLIQYKVYDRTVWVYAPSILKFLKEDNINS